MCAHERNRLSQGVPLLEGAKNRLEAVVMRETAVADYSHFVTTVCTHFQPIVCNYFINIILCVSSRWHCLMTKRSILCSPFPFIWRNGFLNFLCQRCIKQPWGTQCLTASNRNNNKRFTRAVSVAIALGNPVDMCRCPLCPSRSAFYILSSSIFSGSQTEALFRRGHS